MPTHSLDKPGEPRIRVTRHHQRLALVEDLPNRPSDPQVDDPILKGRHFIHPRLLLTEVCEPRLEVTEERFGLRRQMLVS